MLAPSMTFAISSRKLTTETELYDAATRALMRRAYSVHDMRVYLARRTDDEELLGTVMARLRVAKYLDDARYALDFARQHANSRRQGRYRIARELRTRGIADTHIESALAAIFAETDEAALVRARLQRALVSLSKGSDRQGSLDQRKVARLQRSLMRAGFSGDVIRAELKAAMQGAGAEITELPSEESVGDEA
jgi:regulatory protein